MAKSLPRKVIVGFRVAMASQPLKQLQSGALTVNTPLHSSGFPQPVKLARYKKGPTQSGSERQHGKGISQTWSQLPYVWFAQKFRLNQTADMEMWQTWQQAFSSLVLVEPE